MTNDNTGSWNTGDRNTGDRNTGNSNTGYMNTGHRNTGDWNTGHMNTGHMNTGNWNTGNRNTGHRNTGHMNTGNRNTGNRNIGDRNTGNRNIGDRNTGSWNTGDWNTGFMNTDSPTVRMFNKDTGLKFGEISFPEYWFFDLTEWVSGEDMTDQEKEDHESEYKTNKGYLKVYDYKKAFKASWDKATPEDRAKTFDLPNFDKQIFEEISGINVDEERKVETIKIGDVSFNKEEVEERLKGLKPV